MIWDRQVWANSTDPDQTAPRYWTDSTKCEYCNKPKFLDRWDLANSTDPDQTAPRRAVWSGSSLFAIAVASFGQISQWV